MINKSILILPFLVQSITTMAQNLPSKESIKSLQEEISVPITTGQIDLLTDVTYSQIINQRRVTPLKMTILVPRTNDLKPAIIYFPGGGFTSTDYDKFYEIKDALAKAGFVVASADYRVIPNLFPAPVVDGKSAIRYIREHAQELGVDSDRIGILGDSAGGYLVQMLGTTGTEKEYDQGDFLQQSSEVQSVVTMYGISNLLNIGEGFSKDIQAVHASPASTEALLLNGPAFKTSRGAGIGADKDEALKASSLGNVKPNLPPFLIMHGEADNLVSPTQSQQLYDELIKKGNKAQYVKVKGAGHGDITWYQQPIIDKVVDWFTTTLGKPIPNPNGKKVENSNL